MSRYARLTVIIRTEKRALVAEKAFHVRPIILQMDESDDKRDALVFLDDMAALEKQSVGALPKQTDRLISWSYEGNYTEALGFIKALTPFWHALYGSYGSYESMLFERGGLQTVTVIGEAEGKNHADIHTLWVDKEDQLRTHTQSIYLGRQVFEPPLETVPVVLSALPELGPLDPVQRGLVSWFVISSAWVEGLREKAEQNEALASLLNPLRLFCEDLLKTLKEYEPAREDQALALLHEAAIHVIHLRSFVKKLPDGKTLLNTIQRLTQVVTTRLGI